jgi:hypothetical protein
MTYEGAHLRAKQLGHNISAEALNKAERQDIYPLPASKRLYVEVYELSDEEIDLLDVLGAQCQIRRGSNTNPHMRVVDTRVFDGNVEVCTDRVLRYVEERTYVTSAQREVLSTSIKGTLSLCLNPKLQRRPHS